MTEFFDLKSVNNASKSELTAAFNRVLESGWYVLGNEVNRFESEFANYCEVGNCIGVGNRRKSEFAVDVPVWICRIPFLLVVRPSGHSQATPDQAEMRFVSDRFTVSF